MTDEQTVAEQLPTMGDAGFSVHVITTGGTIDKEYTMSGDFDIGAPMMPALFEQARIDFRFTSESACRKDSLDMTDDDREIVRQRVQASPGRNVLITHGTDSMVETADQLVGIQGKVVVLTGAMMPARMRDSDGAFNLGLAIGALHYLPEGVYIAMSGRIFRAGEVRKDRERGRFVDL